MFHRMSDSVGLGLQVNLEKLSFDDENSNGFSSAERSLKKGFISPSSAATNASSTK